MSSDIDSAKSFMNEDEKYIESLEPMERQVLFTTIRRFMRERKRKTKIELLEEEKYS